MYEPLMYGIIVPWNQCLFKHWFHGSIIRPTGIIIVGPTMVLLVQYKSAISPIVGTSYFNWTYFYFLNNSEIIAVSCL